MSQRGERRLDLAIRVALVASTTLVYAQTLGHDFVNYDDPNYVVENARVRSGLHVANVVWAFSTLRLANWHPLTWLSYMLDVELFGVDAGAMHGVNVALHALNALLVYALLRRLTAARWRSALVAGLFALHPLHVESVAWISERKDVLSTAFGLLSLLAYAAWVQRGGRARYLACLLCLILGLLAKPMLVTWPFVFLLLDYWPLERMRLAGSPRQWLAALRPLLLEKLPFFAAALAFVLVVLVAQERAIVEALPLPTRAANAALGYVFYLVKTVWPTQLAPFYPHPGRELPWGYALLAVALLGAATAVCLGPLRARRYLTLGWLFYLGTLVPVIGLVQIGSQGAADRYTYVPLLGIFAALAWALGDAVRWRPALRPLAATLALGVLLGLGALCHAQVARWRDDLSLWQHTLAVTAPNPVALVQYGNALQDRDRLEEAIPHYRAALELVPSYEDGLVALGNALLKQQRVAEATDLLAEAASLRPESPFAQLGMGNARVAAGDFDAALVAFRRAIELAPELAAAHNAAGVALARGGRFAEAIGYFEAALRLRPDLAEAAQNLQAAQRLLAAGTPDAAR